MAYKRSKFSAEVNGHIKTELIYTLSQAGDYDNPTIEWLKSRSIYLTGFTQQKLSRSLNELVELGTVGKAKLKNGRMMYRIRTDYPHVAEFFRKGEEEDEDEYAGEGESHVD